MRNTGFDEPLTKFRQSGRHREDNLRVRLGVGSSRLIAIRFADQVQRQLDATRVEYHPLVFYFLDDCEIEVSLIERLEQRDVANIKNQPGHG